jgi:peptidoglycan/xylan/chitin deacetylase (PgdA/CDA1 family)
LTAAITERGARMPLKLARRLAADVRRREVRRSHKHVGLVLMYHAIGPVSGDPRSDIVPTLASSTFREQLEHLASHYEVVPLGQLRERISARRSGDRLPVAITLDDDLASHIEYAAPALDKLGLPATFFLTGRTLKGPAPFWWQDLQSVADRDNGALNVLRTQLAPRWPWLADADDIRDVAATIEQLAAGDRDEIAARLRELAEDDTVDRGLEAGSVTELAQAGFEVGFHTRRHQSLPLLSDAELREALRDGLAELQEVTRSRPVTIAYPYCRADLRVASAAADAGFETGVVCAGGPARLSQAPLLMDRLNAWSESIEAFAWHLARIAAH